MGGGSVRVPGDCQRAGLCRGSGQQARGHCLIAIRPAPIGAGGPVEEEHFQGPAVALGKDRQVPSIDPAIS
jgi:hypothetical protein